MNNVPKSIRLQIAIFGRTNVGKSSFMNLISGQEISITSFVPGTTTDVVDKTMELLPIGPVVFLDTAGIDDNSELGELRAEKTRKIFDRADIVLLVCEAGKWTPCEEEILSIAESKKIPVIVIINKTDLFRPDEVFLSKIRKRKIPYTLCNATDKNTRDRVLTDFKHHLINNCPDDFLKPPPLMNDLISKGGHAVMIVPIDLQAPKGRLILPQVQTIRDTLDNDATISIVKENDYQRLLSNLKTPPDIIICDSQVVLKMVEETPETIPCTTFSILFSRLKGDIVEMAKGAKKINSLNPGDRVLIAEACTHHETEDDIGRVKIPAWLKKFTGHDLEINVFSGRDYPADLSSYSLAIHCGSCMHNRRETLSRISRAINAGVDVTNYGMAISLMQGVLERVLSPIPTALEAYEAI